MNKELRVRPLKAVFQLLATLFWGVISTLLCIGAYNVYNIMNKSGMLADGGAYKGIGIGIMAAMVVFCLATVNETIWKLRNAIWNLQGC